MANIADFEIAEEKTRGRRPDPAKDQAILDAARALFLEKGYGASIDEIAERAGVVKQTVYSRFQSKEELFAASVHAVAEQLLAPISMATAGKPRETLLAFGDQYHRILLEPGRIQLSRLMIAEAQQFPALAKRYFDAGPLYVRNGLAAFLAKETKAGAMHVGDPAVAASQFLGMIKGVEHLGALLGVDYAENELQRRRRIAAAVDAFMKIYS